MKPFFRKSKEAVPHLAWQEFSLNVTVQASLRDQSTSGFEFWKLSISAATD
jgi:hypothetical protein